MPRNVTGLIASMDWDEFEKRLRFSGERATAGYESDQMAFLDYFGKEEYEYLKQLSVYSQRVRSLTQVSGNIVVVPGLMGSDLAIRMADGSLMPIWIDFPAIVRGGIGMLGLDEESNAGTDGTTTIVPSGVNKRIYARTVMRLQASWNVVTFAYDWRKGIEFASDELAKFIDRHFPDQPVHLVAHSMGGLVSRMFIIKHPGKWERMRSADNITGGRLVMLGTPNYGSFSIPQLLTGEEMTIRLLAAADLDHSLEEVTSIFASFPGFYEMLPFHGKLPPTQQALYRLDSWGEAPISFLHLNKALHFHTMLERPESIDPHRMIVIAGCNRKTPSGIIINAPGDFDYTVTWDGDGCVPHELGLLPEVPSYYVDESHCELPRNEKVLNAVNDLLACGQTAVLSGRPIVSRAYGNTLFMRRNLTGEEVVSKEMVRVSESIRNSDTEKFSEDALRLAEEMILHSAMGDHAAVMVRSSVNQDMHPEKTISLHVELVQADVTSFAVPAIVIGHYKGVPPVNAEGSINSAFGNMIALANRQGIIGGGLGELFFIPVTEKQIRAKTVILAGMGEEGGFSKEDLRYLMTNVTLAVSSLQLDSFATVVVGSGKGNLTKERAIVSIIEGVADAIRRIEGHTCFRRLIFIERFEEEFSEIERILQQLQKDRESVFPCLDLTFPPSRRQMVSGRRKRDRAIKTMKDESIRHDETENGELQGARITIERKSEEDHEMFRFAALSKTAVIPVREIEVQKHFLHGASERLMAAQTRQEQSEFGQLLATYLFPQDFRWLIDKEQALTLMLDRSTAAYPWEMACFRKSRQQVFLGLDMQLTRQFRTTLASPGLMPPLNRSLKVLVIADPAPERELQLEGARNEGRKVVQILRDHEKKIDLTIHERIGAASCDPVEILALLCNVEYDIIHFAGHGIFDEKNPSRSGWVFSRECILSPREIFQIRRVPRLVFANACFSAVIKDRQYGGEESRRLAGLAEAFFSRGIQNYIGTGWPVDDKAAEQFSEVFYCSVLRGETLGNSISKARQGIKALGPTWGAYQHYGQVNASIVKCS